MSQESTEGQGAGGGPRDEAEGGAGGGERDWSRFSRRIEGVLPDLMKKAAASGVKSFLQTEEGIRSLLGALLPREVFHSVSDQLERSRSEAVRLISKEFREFLDRVDIPRELQRLLTSLSIEVKTEIRFVPNDRAVVRPSVKTRATVKPAAPAQTAGGGAEEGPPGEGRAKG